MQKPPHLISGNVFAPSDIRNEGKCPAWEPHPAEEGEAYLNELLGELIGQPLTVHENLESLMEKHSQDKSPALESVEAPEIMTAYLDQHYRKILDEPIPALDNKTPRECSRQAAQHQILIQWLKGLENSTLAAPHMAHYDFKWMWVELGVEYTE